MQTICMNVPSLYLLAICAFALCAGFASLAIAYEIDRYIAYRKRPTWTHHI